MRTATPGSAVVDASVAAAIAFGEPNAELALELVSDVNLFAPTLLHYELCNVARKKAARSPGQLSSITQGLIGALDMDVELITPSHAETLRLALETGLSTYDASYLFVSLMLDAPLVTFDNRLQQAHDALA